jgi:O-antigen/teichoic acid export membrane protein
MTWRVSTLIISKVLSPVDVANYEISYRIFSIAQMLPVVVSTTVFPILINFFKQGKEAELRAFYKNVHFYYLLFGLFSFTFIYTFIDFLMPILFGLNYAGSGIYTKQMFLTILVFPTAFLQANVLVAMKYEKLDMWFNVICLFVNLLFCLVGLYFIKSLSIVTIAIFSGFLFFHILQDIVLVKKQISSAGHAFRFYIFSIMCIGSFVLLNLLINPILLFSGYWIVILSLIYLNKSKRIPWFSQGVKPGINLSNPG